MKKKCEIRTTFIKYTKCDMSSQISAWNLNPKLGELFKHLSSSSYNMLICHDINSSALKLHFL